MQLLVVIMRGINEKRTFEELKRPLFFNVSHKMVNVSLDPHPNGLYFSVLRKQIFSPFLKKGNAFDYRRQRWVKLSPELLDIHFIKSLRKKMQMHQKICINSGSLKLFGKKI